jgi:CBS domain-containing protein
MDLAKTLKIESVWRLNPSQPLQIRSTQTVAEAVALMRMEEVGCLLIYQENRMVGIFTERDLVRRVLAVGKPLTVPVCECMTTAPVVVHKKEPISSAIRRMEEGGYRHLPVVDEGGRVVGLLSVKRIVHYLAEHFPATIFNLPPDPGLVQQDREGA